MKLKYILAALVVALGSLAQAQDGPSYEETVSFLVSKVNIRSGDQNYYKSYRFEELESCRFLYAADNFSTEGPNRTEYSQAQKIITSTAEIDFSELDPTTNEISSHGVHVRSREGRNVISIQTTFFPAYYDYAAAAREKEVRCRSDGSCLEPASYFDRATFYTFDANNNAPRVSRALEHLIRICGGREELF